MDKPCPECKTATTYPDYRRFNLGCLYCGARYVRALTARMADPMDCLLHAQLKQWHLKVVNDWTAWGHDRTELLALADPGSAGLPVAPNPTKPR